MHILHHLWLVLFKRLDGVIVYHGHCFNLFYSDFYNSLSSFKKP